MASRNVKRVSKARSKGTPRRPKQGSPSVSECVDPMTAAVKPAAPPATAHTPAGRVLLGASCTIHEAQALRLQLLDQASHPGPYEIDGSRVEQIDTAGVQLIVGFALDCLERGIHYVSTGRSAALEEAIQTLGVGALLESPGASPNYAAGAT